MARGSGALGANCPGKMSALPAALSLAPPLFSSKKVVLSTLAKQEKQV